MSSTTRDKESDATLTSPSSTIDRTGSNISKGVRWSTEGQGDTEEEHTHSVVHNGEVHCQYEDGPIRIRPWARLLPDRGYVDPIDLDQLTSEDRDLYLDFLPPDPTIRSTEGKSWHSPRSPVGPPYQHGAYESQVMISQNQRLYDGFGDYGDHHGAENNETTVSIEGRDDSSKWPLVEASS